MAGGGDKVIVKLNGMAVNGLAGSAATSAAKGKERTRMPLFVILSRDETPPWNSIAIPGLLFTASPPMNPTLGLGIGE